MIYSLLFGCFMKQPPVETPKQVNTPSIPEIGTPRAFTPPEAIPVPVSFGSNLWVLENRQLPVIVIQLSIPGGSGFDEEQWGRANMVANMLTESVGEYSAVEFSDILYQNAIDVSVSTGVYDSFIRFSFHKDQLDTVLPLLNSMLFSPQFNEKDWERVQTNQINSIRQNLEDAPFIAAQYDGYFLYGANHPIGVPPQGTPKSIENLSREDALIWHKSRLNPSQMNISIVGDISKEAAKEKLDIFFPNWPAKQALVPTILTDITPKKGILLVDMPGAEQTTIRVFAPAFAKDAPDEYAAGLAEIIMGGSFTSRLNSVLRTEKGYAYGASAGFSEEKYQNYASNPGVGVHQ